MRCGRLAGYGWHCAECKRAAGQQYFGAGLPCAVGCGELEDTLCGHVFALSVPSFYQVNRDQAEQLYALAVEFANLKGGETARSCTAVRAPSRWPWRK